MTSTFVGSKQEGDFTYSGKTAEVDISSLSLVEGDIICCGAVNVDAGSVISEPQAMTISYGAGAELPYPRSYGFGSFPPVSVGRGDAGTFLMVAYAYYDDDTQTTIRFNLDPAADVYFEDSGFEGSAGLMVFRDVNLVALYNGNSAIGPTTLYVDSSASFIDVNQTWINFFLAGETDGVSLPQADTIIDPAGGPVWEVNPGGVLQTAFGFYLQDVDPYPGRVWQAVNGGYFSPAWKKDMLLLGPDVDWVISGPEVACTEGGGSAVFTLEITSGLFATARVFVDGIFYGDTYVEEGTPTLYGPSSLPDGTYTITIEDEAGFVLYTATVDISCDGGGGTITETPLKIPFKRWAFHSETHEPETWMLNNNWLEVERWSRTLRCTGREGGVDWEKNILHIPYKKTTKPDQMANNYNVFQRWANLTCEPLNIPWKQWRYPADNNPAHEEENWLAIERWARDIGRCCQGGGGPEE